MARQESYPIDNNITGKDIVLGSDGDNNLKSKNYSVDGLAAYIVQQGNGILQDNFRRILTTPSNLTGQDPEDIINAIDYSVISVSGDTFFTVSDTQLMIFKIPTFDQSAGQYSFIFKYYMSIGKGKGTYGVGGGDVYGAENLLLFLSVGSTVPTTIDATPNVYELYADTLTTPEGMLNADAGSYNVDNATKDSFFYFKKNQQATTSPLEYEFYRWVGIDGDYGIAGGDTAVNGDFELIRVLGDEQTLQNKVVTRNISTGDTIRIEPDNVAAAINRSFRGDIIIPENDVTYFTAPRIYYDSNFTVIFFLDLFGYILPSLTTVISADADPKDFVRLGSLRISALQTTATVLAPVVYDVYDATLTELDAINNSPDTFVLSSTQEEYFVTHRKNITNDVEQIKISRFIGADDTYGFGGTTMTAPDLASVTFTVDGERGIVKLSQIIDDVGYALASQLGGTGLEKIDEGSGDGWALIDRVAANYGQLGLRAKDFSHSTGASSTRGSTATDSATFGRDNDNPFDTSIVFGQDNVHGITGTSFQSSNLLGGAEQIFNNNIIACIIGGERGDFSVAGATLSTGVLFNSFHVGGKNNLIAGHGSGMIGSFLESGAGNCVVVGIANVDVTANVATNNVGISVTVNNPRFVIGCGIVVSYTSGTITLRRNAFEAWGDGLLLAPSLTDALIDTDEDALLVRRYAENNFDFYKQDDVVTGTYTMVALDDHSTKYISGTSTVVSFDGTGDVLRDAFQCRIFNDGSTKILIQGINGYTYNGSTILSPNEGITIVRKQGTANFYSLNQNTITTPLRQINSVDTLSVSDEIVEVTANTFNFTLQANSVYAAGIKYIVKNSGAGVTTVLPDGAETIDGAASVVLNQYDSVTLAPNGANWIVL